MWGQRLDFRVWGRLRNSAQRFCFLRASHLRSDVWVPGPEAEIFSRFRKDFGTFSSMEGGDLVGFLFVPLAVQFSCLCPTICCAGVAGL